MENRIKEVRKCNGDTLQSLAKKINYDYSNLSKIERGLYVPTISLLKKIAEVYEVDISDLLVTEKRSKEVIDLQSKNLLVKYELELDGRKVSADEISVMTSIIRKLRNAASQNS
ncbi:helix-turn-helix transcriptional regulator [Metabacillus sp. KIGAM252]|uniref:Helix-turn-helix transcriptional regulator n=1 Tax=Metabacillus flavus TaxID=2823519 RepID=A0ABS5LAE7_9BACI|nr:helix-turn-helix transcriptional regulator [Metabacillus flavus]MBS2967693.1 helix-turn-helix transcriptional regulator [Metabacillus flavus]